MSKNYNQNPKRCGYCGKTLDVDSLYQNRKYHKWTPNCSQWHNQFLMKMRKARDSDVPYIQRFVTWADKQLEENLKTEKNLHPLVATLLTRKHKTHCEVGLKLSIKEMIVQ